MTVVIAVLSEYVVGTIEDASETWGLSVSFIGIILLPIVGNAAEHAGAVIFAFKNKLDFSLGVALAGGVVVAVFLLLLMRGPRRFLFRHTLGRLQSEKNVVKKNSLHLASMEQRKADENVLRLVEEQKGEGGCSE